MQVYKRHGANNGAGNNLKSISSFKDKKAKGLILQKIIQIPGYSTRTRRTNYISITYSVQLLSRVQLIATPWTAACQASLSITNSQSLSKPMSIKSVMPSNHLILCRPLLLLPSILPSIRVFSNESALLIRWPKYWSFSFNISSSNEHPGLISFRMDWLDLLAVQGALKGLLQNHSSKASILHEPNIPGSYAMLLFIASDLAAITSHIHNWVLFLLWLHPFILSEVIFPLLNIVSVYKYRKPQRLSLFHVNAEYSEP